MLHINQIVVKGRQPAASPITQKTKEKIMATIMPQGELVRKAAGYILEQRAQYPHKQIATLLDEAGMRFNLSPAEAASLERLLQKENGGESQFRKPEA
jgi:hypothetical protein